MKNIIILLLLGLSLDLLADCRPAYRKFRAKTRVAPLATPLSSSGQSASGAFSSTGAGILGTSILNTELSTAGFLYGAAFFYEGQYTIQETLADFRQYKSRMKVYKILKEARRGFGDHLENFLEDLKASFINENAVTNEELIDVLNKGNLEKAYCPEGKQLYNLKNLGNYLITKIFE